MLLIVGKQPEFSFPVLTFVDAHCMSWVLPRQMTTDTFVRFNKWVLSVRQGHHYHAEHDCVEEENNCEGHCKFHLRVFSLFWTDWSLSFLAHSLSYVTITFLSIMFTETSDSRTTSSSYRLRHRRGLISVSEPFVIRNKSDSSFFCIIWSQRAFFQLMSLILN